ncbi:chorismate-binding protein [Sinomonas atrocyanea]|uniref:chorismate-binding protein n=1 Tax=Sinomonas atrocyanea TaxID=37927 RepID=UPI003D973AB0
MPSAHHGPARSIPAVIAVDGRSGAGKTSLAVELAAALRTHRSVALVHLEDVYPGWDGLAAGIERCAAGILAPLRRGEAATWRAWDWAAGLDGEERVTEPADVVVLEGVGAGAARLRGLCDAVVWVEAEAAERKRRALERDGETYAPHWDRWAAQEDVWLADDDVRAAAAVVVGGAGGTPDRPEGSTGQVLAALAELPALRDLLAPERTERESAGVVVRRFTARPDAERLFARLFGDAEHAVWLDASDAEVTPTGAEVTPSDAEVTPTDAEVTPPDAEVTPSGADVTPHARQARPRSRFSIMADDGGLLGRRMAHERGTTEVVFGPATPTPVTATFPSPFFRWLDTAWGHSTAPAVPGLDCEFALGWLGYLGYELKRECGGSDVDAGLPDAQLLFAARAVVLDHANGEAWVLALESPDAAAWIDAASAAIDACTDGVTSAPHEVTSAPHGVTSTPHQVTSAPHGVTSTPHGVTSAPHGVTSAPHQVTSAPHEVTSTPHQVTSTPHQVTSTPHQVTSTPHQVTSAPHGVTSTPHGVTSAPHGAPVFAARDSAAAYMAKVSAAQAEIAEGNTYEVCLTTTLEATLSGRGGTPGDRTAVVPLETYCALRRRSPAPFAAFARFGGLSIASTSPERFLALAADGALRAEPIKGTRRRRPGASAEEDAGVVRELAANPKDRAENLMIVDLLRNDLSHHAVPGSVGVSRLFAVESYATVHQLVSTIDARLRPGASRAEAVAAAFPPGSMTGAPKISTMQILDRLEAGPRGVYSGAIGYFSRTGAADLSVVIRTLVMERTGAGAAHEGATRLTLGVGGAVVADSDPADEYEEIRTKAFAVLDTLGSVFPAS